MAKVVDWFEALQDIDSFEDIEFDKDLITRLQQAASHTSSPKQIQFHNPSFKSCQTSEFGCDNVHRWPAISITGGYCKLQCEHCRSTILKPMLAATTPSTLWRLVNELVEKGAQGMLLTGGSNQRNEIDYRSFWPVVRRIKALYPEFEITCHTALINHENALRMSDAGVDVAMMDVIGAQDTIRRVYHLKRDVADFAASLKALCQTSMRVVPHVVLGLHFGKLLGEWHALEIIKEAAVDGVVLVAVMPHFASHRYQQNPLDSEVIARFILYARHVLPSVPLSLGCARPAGQLKTKIDAYALMAGVDRIAHPAEGLVQLAITLGHEVQISSACCSVAMRRQASMRGQQSNQMYSQKSLTVVAPVRV